MLGQEINYESNFLFNEFWRQIRKCIRMKQRGEEKSWLELHVLSTSMHGTLHTRCIETELLYVTGTNEVGGSFGHMACHMET